MFTLILLSLTSLLTAITGVLIKYFKYYTLIAGYNTASPEDQAKYDVKKLSEILGNGLFLVALLLMAGGIFQYNGWMIFYTICLIGIWFPISYMIIKGRQYEPNRQERSKEI